MTGRAAAYTDEARQSQLYQRISLAGSPPAAVFRIVVLIKTARAEKLYFNTGSAQSPEISTA
ncbi:UNVERIFIED_ORG: hypothetical protein GGI63_003747 [Rhizobium esperanzae]